jgi:hypothetical protein
VKFLAQRKNNPFPKNPAEKNPMHGPEKIHFFTGNGQPISNRAVAAIKLKKKKIRVAVAAIKLVLGVRLYSA